MGIIKQITDQIESVEGVQLLDVDPGKATNRTVVTFVGTPDEVVEAAFRGIKKASELIDMSHHKGEHPRFGATDVCPFVPIPNISMDETVEYARKLAEKVGTELQYPVFCYEYASFKESRRNLANVRSGEYEGLAQKLSDPEWKPDFGPASFVPKTGATAISARNFLVAYNVNLNTTSTRRANSVAFDVREAGRLKRAGNPISGKVVKDENGKPVREAGSLKKVKAIGWYIEEFGICQISMNLTDITVTSVHQAYDEVYEKSRQRGLRVTGSELVGLIPLNSILEAGKYFLRKQQRSIGLPESELIKIAVKSMGLDELGPFNPEEKIIEYQLKKGTERQLVDLSLQDFMEEIASESPAPGGGSVSAYMGSMGVALTTMVANLSSHKRGWDERWEEFSEWADMAKLVQEKLLRLVDEDTRAFNSIMEAFGLPKNSDEEKEARQKAIEKATLYAIEIPFEVMVTAFGAFEIAETMVLTGNPNSVTDAGVGALAMLACVEGAWLNVKINSTDLKNHPRVQRIVEEGKELVKESAKMRSRILQGVDERI